MSHPLPDERFFGPVTTWNRDVENYLEGVFGVEHLQRINRALCTPPITATIRVNTLRASPADALHELTTLLHSQIATGLCSTPYLHPQLPYVLQIPGSGPHTIDYAAAVDPDVGFVREIAVNRICGEAVLRGADVFVPGVMGATKSIEAGQIVAVSIAKEPPPNATTCRPLLRGTILYSAGDPAVPQDEERRASAAQAESLDRGSLHLGLGIVQLPRVQLFKEARGVAVKMLRRVFELPSMEGVLTGRGMLQNLPSIVAAHVLAPRPGARVMDMCASPGGKTTALAQLMGDQGELIALDRSHAKVQDIVNLCTELGVTCVKAYKMDASWACRKVAAAAAAATPTETETAGPPVAASVESKGSTAPSAKEQARAARRKAAAAQRGMPDPDSLVAARADLTDGFDPESFDHLLLDAPCSALGIRPRLTQSATMQELERTAAYQRGLLDTAVRLLKVGGTMVYSTCTISPMENEANVRYLLDRYPEVRLIPQSVVIGGPGLVGVYPRPRGSDGDPLAAGPFDEWLTAEEAPLVQRFDPSAGEYTGFFVAKFEKMASIGSMQAVETST